LKYESKQSLKRDRAELIEIGLWLIGKYEALEAEVAELKNKPRGDVLAVIG
jgi:hypothetical protein